MYRAITVLAAVATTVRADPRPVPHETTRRDKIVRLEQDRNRISSRSLLFCEVRPDRNGACYGTEPPRVGDYVAVVDEHARAAELRILNSVRHGGASDTCSVMWDVSYDVTSGNLDTAGRNVVGVLGIDVAPSGHLVHEDLRASKLGLHDSACQADEQLMVGLDRDGDDALDLAITLCSAANGTGSRYGDFIVNFWSLAKGAFVKLETLAPGQLAPCLH